MKKTIIVMLIILKSVSSSYSQDVNLNLGFENLGSSGNLIGWIHGSQLIVGDAYEGSYAVKIFTYYTNLTSMVDKG